MEELNLETERNKKKLVKELRRSPIVQLACKKTGIGRSTYYKWRLHDKVFARACEQAIKNGESLINDIVESKLISLAQGSNLEAMKFWLKHNHQKYAVTTRDINVYNIASSLPSVEELAESKRVLSLDLASKVGAKIKAKNDTRTKEELELELLAKDETIWAKMQEYTEEEEQST